MVFGCRKITIDVINHILDNYSDRCELIGVVEQDYERDRVYHQTLVSEHCDSLGVKHVRFDKKIDRGTIEEMNPDVIFSLYYRKILKQEILDIPRLGCINVHPAYLPKNRGPAPLLWDVLNGEKMAGATMHYMVEGVDAGDIIDQREVDIGSMTGFELSVRASDVGFEIFKDNFDSILDGTNKRTPQNHSKAMYCLPFKKSLRYIYWGDPDRILNQLRAFAKPFDGAIAWTMKKVKVTVWEARKLETRESFAVPGFYNVTDDGIMVQTGTVPILITNWEVSNGELKNHGRFQSGPPVAELYSGEASL